MRTKTAYFLTRLIGTVLVFSAASSFAATLYPFYLAGGLVSWTSATPSAPQSDLGSFSASSKDDGYRIGVGFSFNEEWSVEACYLHGPTQNLTFSGTQTVIVETPFNVDFVSKREFTVFRANPVYEYTLFRPISVQLKAGVARIQGKQSVTTTLNPITPGGNPVQAGTESGSLNETKAFASTALKLNFRDGTVAVVASVVRYFDAVAGMDQALELDLFWRF